MKSKGFSVTILVVFSIFFLFGILYNKYTSYPTVKEPKKEHKEELAFIYFGCSTCNFANNKKIIEAISNLKSEFKENFSSSNYSLKFVGTSNETDVYEGIKYLKQFGEFDEISVGNEMSNIVIQKYIWDYYETPIMGGTPQILIEKRVKSIISQSPVTIYSAQFDSTEIITRVVGLNPILEFDFMSVNLQ